MIAESRPFQRPPEARLLTIDAAGHMRQVPRADFVTMLKSGDLVIANDAATLPASLHGTHVATGTAIEVRLAGWPSATLDDPRRFHAIVSGRATTASAPRIGHGRPFCTRGIALLSVRSRRGSRRCSATLGSWPSVSRGGPT
jgi:hypothetical protein